MRIALIHAVEVAMRPVEAAFGRLWPEADLMHVLDDSLSQDRARDGALTDAMTARFVTLARYGASCGADGVLFTCSAFGPAIEAASDAVDIPVLKPNEAMFRDALDLGSRIGLLASFEPSLGPMQQEFSDLAAGQVDLICACEPRAMTALKDADGAAHDALLADAAVTLGNCDAILLAQFSTARAKQAVENAAGRPVLTSPDSAVLALRGRLDG